MSEKRCEPAETSPQSDGLEDFYDKMQHLVVDQAKRIIDLSLYHKTLLSTLPVALLGTDPNGVIRSTNHAAEEILGFAEGQLKGRRLTDLFSSGSEAEEKIHQVLETGRPVHLDAKSLRLSSDKEIVGNFYFQPLRDDEDDICGLLLTVEDITYVHYLHNAFKRYVPPSVSEIIARDPQSLTLGGEEKVLTVLFSDLVGFTSIAERYTPQEMVTLLSEYFKEMTDQVFSFRGTLKEYVGDELMAIYGAPIAQSEHPLNACASALAMQDRLAEMNVDWQKMGRPTLKARIGVNTGPMLVGNLGSPYRFSYGVVGDQVNLASRLEGLSSIYGTDILIGEETAERVKNNFILREVDRVRVKGRKQNVGIFELIAPIDQTLPASRESAMACYAEGLDAYRQQHWTRAMDRFEKTIELRPEDGPAKTMTERCLDFKDRPPGEKWDGTFNHQSKK